MVAKELDIELKLILVDLLGREQDGPQFRQMFPEGMVPAIDDNGFYLWEGQAIITYLMDKFSPGHSLYPTDPQSRAHVHRFLHFDNGSLFPALKTLIYRTIYFQEEMDPEKEQAFRAKVSLLDQALNGKRYLSGNDLTVADLACYASMSQIWMFDNLDMSLYPEVRSWMDRLRNGLPYDSEVTQIPIQQFKEFMAKRKASSSATSSSSSS
jgi:glutathione S-transferase